MGTKMTQFWKFWPKNGHFCHFWIFLGPFLTIFVKIGDFFKSDPPRSDRKRVKWDEKKREKHENTDFRGSKSEI